MDKLRHYPSSKTTINISPEQHPTESGTEMLVFDIETTGLDPSQHRVTCVCTQDYYTNATKVYEFARAQHENPEDIPDLIADLGRSLDSATSLCAFNGVRFDIPFLQVALGYAPERAAAWIMKTSDILEQCRLLKGCTFSLNLLCEANGVQVKSSNGLEAVYMAQRREWKRLRDYCAGDVQILCDLYRKRYVVNPRSKETMDLASMAHPALYQPVEAGEHRRGCNAAASQATGADEGNEGEARGSIAGGADTRSSIRRALRTLQQQLRDASATAGILEGLLASPSI